MSVDARAMSAVIIRDPRRRLLTVPEPDGAALTLPQAVARPGESPVQTALRALQELGITLAAAELTPCGEITTRTSSTTQLWIVPGSPLHDAASQDTTAPAEGQGLGPERQWLAPDDRSVPLAPLLTEHVLDYLQAHPIHSVAVFSGARAGQDGRHLVAARAVGESLARNDMRLVYGGSAVGLMGAVATAALEAGGAVSGVLPQSLMHGEIAHPGLTQLEVVETMHARKQRMSERADAFLCLPGGTGTLDEFFDVWTGQQLGYHAKPIALLDSDYWAPTLRALSIMVEEGFVRAEDYDALILGDSPEEILQAMRTWTAPRPKWS
ncbi:TIGR00730 family Rossman fold protein [Corynebacterium sp. TAE3-ERU30]|uniref:TIGR00730 family Rossman fold protein n=1 Tax=Corynebacterium sp. TAE3-ERU30 TaxID=2849496 RepID=UPI001C4828AA|nr:TIGR00730 family Rossman fold protein [Corynebacterium sp. TAE3-ERU30]MBV7282018.1 TIGR00730 family Rossman fold protein [Corynebacterium sp. TAE3-ERU30]